MSSTWPARAYAARSPRSLETLVNSDESALAAGDFSAWLAAMQRALAGDAGADVPCGGCTGCCTSSQFVLVEPDETEARAHIPAELLFPAPRLPAGHLLLGYDENGHCPMLVDGACSIYEHRPRTCRTYDCRVFPAAGVELDATDDADKAVIAERAQRWRFTHPTARDRAEHDAVRAAARFVHERADELPADVVPVTATQRAVLAVRVHEAFLAPDATTGDPVVVTDPDPEAVRVTIATRRRGGPGGRVGR
jgi:Fe-S-cluster containining protein